MRRLKMKDENQQRKIQKELKTDENVQKRVLSK